jgi:hypothetical protein
VTTSAGVTFVVPMACWKNGRPHVHFAVGNEDVDGLAELIDRTVDVAPLPSNLHTRLVDLPARPNCATAGPSGLGQQRGVNRTTHCGRLQGAITQPGRSPSWSDRGASTPGFPPRLARPIRAGQDGGLSGHPTEPPLEPE